MPLAVDLSPSTCMLGAECRGFAAMRVAVTWTWEFSVNFQELIKPHGPLRIKSRAYAVCAGMFGLIGIAAVTRHEILAGIFVFLIAIACALRANHEWKREHA